MSTVQTQTQNRNSNSAHRGGQASIGLFGTPGFNAPRQPLPRTPKASRIKGALNSFSSDGLTPAAYRKAAAPAMRAAARASDERESRRTDEDDHADFLARCGAVEEAVGITLSIED